LNFDCPPTRPRLNATADYASKDKGAEKYTLMKRSRYCLHFVLLAQQITKIDRNWINEKRRDETKRDDKNETMVLFSLCGEACCDTVAIKAEPPTRRFQISNSYPEERELIPKQQDQQCRRRAASMDSNSKWSRHSASERPRARIRRTGSDSESTESSSSQWSSGSDDDDDSSLNSTVISQISRGDDSKISPQQQQLHNNSVVAITDCDTWEPLEVPKVISSRASEEQNNAPTLQKQQQLEKVSAIIVEPPTASASVSAARSRADSWSGNSLTSSPWDPTSAYWVSPTMEVHDRDKVLGSISMDTETNSDLNSVLASEDFAQILPLTLEQLLLERANTGSTETDRETNSDLNSLLASEDFAQIQPITLDQLLPERTNTGNTETGSSLETRELHETTRRPKVKKYCYYGLSALDGMVLDEVFGKASSPRSIVAAPPRTDVVRFSDDVSHQSLQLVDYIHRKVHEGCAPEPAMMASVA
jgi:hypothetical protein